MNRKNFLKSIVAGIIAGPTVASRVEVLTAARHVKKIQSKHRFISFVDGAIAKMDDEGWEKVVHRNVIESLQKRDREEFRYLSDHDPTQTIS